MKKSVLLIDDEPIINAFHQRLLQQCDQVREIFSVQSAVEANMFLELADKNMRPIPDVIFLDINMPYADGFDFINGIRSLPTFRSKKSDIIIISSAIDKAVRERAARLGITKCYLKPLDERQVKDALAEN